MKQILVRIDANKDIFIVFLDTLKNGMFDVFSLADGYTTASREWIVSKSKNFCKIPVELLTRIDFEYNVNKRMPVLKIDSEVLYDSDRYDFDTVKKEIELSNGCEMTAETVYNLIDCYLASDWDATKELLSLYDKQSANHVCVGTLGLWNGLKPIVPTVNENLLTLIQKAINGLDCVKIEFDNGKILVTGSHHDGTNTFSIQPLNERGNKANFGTIHSGNVKRYVKKYERVSWF